ncbi:metallophosphoesterase family protein [Sphingomonas sp.]|uniref:metallophosphoesterase family protein n=1 Tax=Sphingomonas sp. TaxID=28214 RepID=UPI0025FAC8E5|nr:metallophosphoesterase family protein [Sphingomonas sp.]
MRPTSTQNGERIYAIGDVHGRLDLLKLLLARLELHSETLPDNQNMHLILLGDLVDRGPDSAETLRYVRNLSKQSDQLVTLLGNHEELMLRALSEEPGMLRAWSRSGGAETLRSFGFAPPERGCDEGRYIAQVKAAIPQDWLTWLASLPLSASSGDYFFCHAGIRPGTTLKRQARTDLLWIRDDFLDDNSDHGAVIVHGHSISREVEVRQNRIGIDTGAYQSDVLTALYLEGSVRKIISSDASQAIADA